jgi:hypothetical protein
MSDQEPLNVRVARRGTEESVRDYERTWREVWKRLVCDKRGRPVLDKIKRELHDYHIVLGEVSRVYDELTGGMLSKPTTRSEAVIDAVNESTSRKVRWGGYHLERES